MKAWEDGLGHVPVDWAEGGSLALSGVFRSWTGHDIARFAPHICLHDCVAYFHCLPSIGRPPVAPRQGVQRKLSAVVVDHVLAVSSFHPSLLSVPEICEE